MGVEETIRGAFTEARDYKNVWDAYNKKVAAGERNLLPPRRDLRLEPLVEVLEGKRYVHSHCYREDEILMLLRVAKEFGFKVRTSSTFLKATRLPMNSPQPALALLPSPIGGLTKWKPTTPSRTTPRS